MDKNAEVQTTRQSPQSDAFDCQFQKLSLAYVLAHQERFNTLQHTADESPIGSKLPSEEPCQFNRWADYIYHDRHVSIPISLSERELFLRASTVVLLNNRLSEGLLEDIMDTAIYKRVEEAVPRFAQTGIFLRLDHCSPKDGIYATQPLRSAKAIFEQMLSSRRTTSSLRRYPDERLFLLPYNDKMRIEYELRCFARPGGKLVAISQYRWHQACAFASGGEEQLYLIYKAVEDVLERLKATPMWEDLMEDGFIFDCLWDPNTRTCSLIELNPFGPMSSTGAALFNWIEDGQIIGGEHDKVVFRYCA